MAREGILTCIPGLVSGADLSAAANQYRFVKLTAANTIGLCAAVTDKPIGVLQNTPGNGEAAVVACAGLSKVKAGEAVAVGSTIGTAADGDAQVVTVGTETTVYVAGTAVDAAGADGDIFTALINLMNPARAA